MRYVFITFLLATSVVTWSLFQEPKYLGSGEMKVATADILDSKEFVENGKTIVQYAYKSSEIKPKIHQDVVEKQYETYTEEVNGKTIEKQKLNKQGQPILKSEKRIISEEILEKRTNNTITAKVIGEDNKFFTQSGYNFTKDSEGWKEVKYATTTKTEFDKAKKVSLLGWVKTALAADTGATSPNSVENVDLGRMGQDWSDIDNIKVSDDVYATNVLSAEWANALYGSGFGFNIPDDATITGIKSETEIKSNSGEHNFVLGYINGTSTATKTYQTGFLANTIEQYYALGGDGNHGLNYWLPSEINDNSFSVIAYDTQFLEETITVSIDHTRLTVYYKLNISSSTKSTATITNNNATGTVAWSNPTNASSSDNIYATASLSSGQVTNYLEFNDFGFAIPSGSVIEGIGVTIEAKMSVNGGSYIAQSCLVKSASGYCNLAQISFITTDLVIISGGTQSLFGTTWTPAEINDSGFGYRVAFKQRFSTPTVSVDYIEISVFYSEGGSNTKVQIRSSAQFKGNVIIK